MSTQSHCPVSLPSFSELFISISSPSDPPFSPPGDPPSVTTSHIKRIAKDHKEQKNGRSQGELYGRAMTISLLPDDVLLEIFDIYKVNNHPSYYADWKWDRLVHVCRRWRRVIFASPFRLNLRILCTSRSPVRKNLGIWPALPITIDFGFHSYRRRGNLDNVSNINNIIKALEHADRVCDVRLYAFGSELEKITTAMQEPFLVLGRLYITSIDRKAPVIPAEFLGGSAPSLLVINLIGIPFPALPALLLSTSDLVTLHLREIPRTGYFSPEAMAVGLAALPRLKSFIIGFRSATSRPDRIHPPPASRTVLPALTYFVFQGVSEYLGDLVSRIDSPQLDRINIRYLNRPVDFQVAQVAKFIDRSVGPKLTLIRNANVTFYNDHVAVTMFRPAGGPNPDPPLATTTVLCEGIDWQVPHMTQVLSQFSSTFSSVVHLKFEKSGQFEGTDNVEWLHLLRQFSTVQTLHVSRDLAGHVALALQHITAEMVADTLPSLDFIYLEGQPGSSIQKFVAARRLSDCPVTVLDTKLDFDERVASYVGK